MRVDRHGGMAKGHRQNHIGRLAADTGQGDQRIAVFRHDTVKIVDQFLRQGDDVLRLVAVQTDGLDVVAHLGFAQRQHFLRRVGDLEQLLCRLVDADIGGLRRQGDGDNQRVGIDVVQLAFRLRAQLFEAAENLGHFSLGVFGPRQRLVFARLRLFCRFRFGTYVAHCPDL